ncbi:MAG TPA: cytochrome c biogenesis protein CcdC [Polyangiaceae bacterium]|nr:cytochrome c biogenesis protein CcdC [Polyangiaceae bacterium]
MHVPAIVGSLVGVVGSIVGGVVILAWRVRETQTPVTAKKLLLPPLAMSSGFSMFFAPQMRVPWTWALCAFAAGALLFAYPLIHTSRMVRQGEVILMQRSRAFLVILLGLFAVRLLARQYVEQYVSMTQTAALFFVLAFGMLLPWRLAMFASYRGLLAAKG